MGASATTWPVSDLVRLLLALAKAKKASLFGRCLGKLTIHSLADNPGKYSYVHVQLAVVKPDSVLRQALNAEDKALLLKQAAAASSVRCLAPAISGSKAEAAALKPELGSLPAADVIKHSGCNWHQLINSLPPWQFVPDCQGLSWLLLEMVAPSCWRQVIWPHTPRCGVQSRVAFVAMGVARQPQKKLLIERNPVLVCSFSAAPQRIDSAKGKKAE